MIEKELNSLINKYLNGEASETEIKFIDDWYQSFEEQQGFLQLLKKEEIEQAVHISFETFKATLSSTN